MAKQTTYRWLVWIVVILLATNISMAVSFISHNNRENNEETLKTETTTENAPVQQQTRFFKEKLNLRPDQMDSFRELNRNYNRTSHAIARDLEALRFDMVKELGKEQSNPDSLDIITTKIGEKHKELKNITIDYYQKMSELCDPQQRGKLNEIFMSMLKSSDQEQFPQRGRRNRFRNQ